ncbi:MAG: hypothetical protein ACE5K2_05005 [Candidatus Zixiibacteriota bacterium]
MSPCKKNDTELIKDCLLGERATSEAIVFVTPPWSELQSEQEVRMSGIWDRHKVQADGRFSTDKKISVKPFLIVPIRKLYGMLKISGLGMHHTAESLHSAH